MTDSLDELVEFLLGEIALGGESGLTFTDIAARVRNFYSRSSDRNQQIKDTNLDGRLNPSSCHTRTKVDRPFLIKVWTWLVRLPDVSVGKEGQFNDSNFIDLERLYPECFSLKYDKSIPASDNSLTIDASQSKVSDSALVRGVTTERPLPCLFVNEERMWIAICGHTPDPTRVFSSEWILLLHIAARRHDGIFQGELVRLSGQDKRSVPKRTDVLHEKGYIVKRTVYMKGNKTSRLYLRRFADAPSTQDDINMPLQDEVTVRSVAAQLFGLLKNNPLVPQQDIADALGMNTPGTTHVLSLLFRHFRKVNCLKRVKMAFGPSARSKDLKVCIQLLREPTDEDWQNSDSQGLDFDQPIQALATSYETDPDLQSTHLFDQEIVDEPSEHMDQEAMISPSSSAMPRSLPQWNIDRNLANVLFDVIREEGSDGLTNTKARNIITGPFVKRTLESLLVKLSTRHLQAQSAPERQFSILRSHDFRNGILQYVHFSFEIYEAKVRSGESSWKNVSGGDKISGALSQAGKDATSIEQVVNTDNFGFAIRAKPVLQFQNGEVTMPRLLQGAKVRAIYKRPGEPVLQERGQGRLTITFHKNVKHKSKTEHQLSNGVAEQNTLPSVAPSKYSIKSNNTPKQDDKKATKARGRPRKFVRGTEKYWRDVFAFIGRENTSENSKQQCKKRKSGAEAEKLFNQRPAMFDHTILQAIGLGLPVASDIQDISQDWVDQMQAVINRSQQGVYISPTGYHLGSRHRAARILIFRSPRLRDEIDWDRQQMWPWQQHSSSASHSFRRQTLHPKSEEMPCSVEVSSSFKRVRPNTRIEARVQFESPLRDEKPSGTQKSEASTRFQKITSHAKDSYRTQSEPLITLRGAIAGNEDISHRTSITKELPTLIPSPDPILTDNLSSSRSKTTPVEALPMSCSNAQMSSVRSRRKIKLSQKAVDNLLADGGTASQVNQQTKEVSGTNDTTVLNPEKSAQSISFQTETASLSPNSDTAVPISEVDGGSAIGNDQVQERDSDRENIDRTFSGLAEHIAGQHQHDELLQRSIDIESASRLALYDFISDRSSTIRDSGLNINKDGEQRSASPTVQDAEDVSPISNTHETTTLPNAEIIGLSADPPRQDPPLETHPEGAAPDAQDLAGCSSEDSEPVIRRGPRTQTKVNPRRAKRDGLDVMTRPQVSKLCRILVLELLGLCSGLAPNVPWSFRRAMIPRWHEANVTADQLTTKSVRAAIKSLCENGKIRQITFAFRAKTGVMVKMSVVALQGIDSTNPAVIELQDRMRDVAPADYIPHEWETESNRAPNEWNKQRYNKEIRQDALQDDQRKVLSTSSFSRKRVSKSQKRSGGREAELSVDNLPNRSDQDTAEALDLTSRSESQAGIEGESNSVKPSNVGFLTLPVPHIAELNLNTEYRHTYRPADAPHGEQIEPNSHRPSDAVWEAAASRQDSSRPKRAARLRSNVKRLVWTKNPPTKLPSNLDEIPNMKLSRERAMLLATEDPERAKFEAEIDCVATWEMKLSEFLIRETTEEVVFINHVGPAKNFPRAGELSSIQYGPIMRYQEHISDLVEIEPPSTQSWPPFVKALSRNESELDINTTAQRRQKSRKRKANGQKTTYGDGDDDDNNNVGDDEYLLQSEPRRKRIKGPTRSRRSLRTVQDRSKTGVTSYTSLRRNRLTQVLRYLTENEKYQIVVAVVVVRTLAGGIEKYIDWAIVKALLPTQEEYVLRDAWRTMMNRFRNDVSDLTESLQQAYIEALVEDKVPSVNFDDVRATDWPGVFHWALSNLDKTIMQKPEELPASRSRLLQHKDYVFNDNRGVQDLFAYNIMQPIQRKEQILSGIVFGKPLQAQNGGLKPLELGSHAEEEEADVELVRAKSWVMATMLTPETSFDAAKVQAKLLTLGSTRQKVESLLERAVSSLQRDKLIVRSHGSISASRNRGGGSGSLDLVNLRQYEASAKFFENFEFRRLITASMLKRAATYKIDVLDAAAAQNSVIILTKDTILDDGEMVAILNLFGMGMLSIRPSDDIPVNRWGLEWQKHGYTTRLVDKRALGFNVALIPNKLSYIRGDLLSDSMTPTGTGDENRSAGRTRITRGDVDLPDRRGVIPVWFDINLDFQSRIWEMVLAAVVGLVSVRPGVDAREIARTVRYGVSSSEVEMVLTWAEQVGAVTRTNGSGGWETTECWWFCLGSHDWN